MTSTNENKESEFKPIPLSSSVNGAISRLQEDFITAKTFAIEIMKRHKEYGNHISSKILADEINNNKKSKSINRQSESKNSINLTEENFSGKKRHVREWAELVSEVYNPEVIKELNGRFFIIGLSLLDEELNKFFKPYKFIEAIQKELREKLDNILSENGAQLRKQNFPPSISDDILNQTDNEIKKLENDQLDRSIFAEFLVSLLNNVESNSGSFSFHIYGPWGAGKSSVLNFMKEILESKENKQTKINGFKELKEKEQKKTDETKKPNDKEHKNSGKFGSSIVVEYNAWQHQNLKYPWWTLLDIIYSKIKSKLSLRIRLKEWFWRFSSLGLTHYLALFLVIGLIGYFVFSQNALELFDDKVIKFIVGILTLGGIIFGAIRYSLFGSEKAAEYYIESTQDPMNKFKKRFNKFIKDCAPYRVVVIVDDLDRCRSSFVVEILENIQTLFKEANVVFIIAADKKWINACYELEYDKIKSFIGEKGKSIGALFTEKMFQISVSLPGVTDEIRKSYWGSMLGMGKKIADNLDSQDKEQISTAVNHDEINNLLLKNSNMSFEKNHAIRLEIVKRLGTQSIMNITEHKLLEYYQLLDINPRSMKRLLNCFTVNRVSSLISHIDIDQHQLILWTIITMRWPLFGEFLITKPDIIDELIQKNVELDLPPEIRVLIHDQDVINVLSGIEKGKLSPESVRKCEYFI